MPSDLSQYLASRYLVADSKSGKKRKRRNKGGDGLLVTEDDDAAWSKRQPAQGGNEDDKDSAMVATVAGTSADFRRAKKSAWTTVVGLVRDPSKTAEDKDSDAAAAADAILSAAAAENEAARNAEDELPVVDEGNSKDMTRLMSDGTRAGLQSAESVTAQLKKRQSQQREEANRMRKDAKKEEVAYRDAAGQRVDVSMRRAEARQAAAALAEKDRLAKEALVGDVQREEARLRRDQLDDAQFMKLARHADDKDLNDELKARQHWNDPMMKFLASGGHSSSNKKRKKKGTSKPEYAGGAPPNRYGIRPGYRWDGVDRGTGFEAERFKAINRRERNKDLDYSWQMDE